MKTVSYRVHHGEKYNVFASTGFDSLEEAKKKISELGNNCKSGENKNYWKKVAKEMFITRVIEIEERIDN